jgi:5-methylcytosine-specific restriction endonuclease McrA
MKSCNKCNETKPLDSFHRDSSRKSGLNPRCKQCISDYNQKNKDTLIQRSIDWRNSNRERFNEYRLEYNKKNKNKINEISRISRRKRRALKLQNGFEKYSESQVINKYGIICYLCNKEIDLSAARRVGVNGWELGLHIDHFIPLSKGGPDTLENVRPTHGLCNVKKSHMIQ